MPFFCQVFTAGLLLSGAAAAQTRPVTRDTLPTAPVPNFTGPNRLQQLYDYYHSPSSKAKYPKSVPNSEPRPAATVRPNATPAPQQRLQPADIRIGVRGGVTYPVFRQAFSNYSPSVGFVGGLIAQKGTGRLSYQTELNYVRYVTRYRDDYSGRTRPTATDRVELPVLVKFTTGSTAGTHWFVNGGAYVSFVTSASLNGVKQPVVGNRVTAGIIAGVGTALKTRNGQFIVEARGLYQPGPVFSGNPLRAVLTQATLGYVVPLGGR